MTFLDSVRERAAASRRRIVFAEGDDPRTIAAARRLAAEGVVTPILIGPCADSIEGVEVHMPGDNACRTRTMGALLDARSARGLTEAQAAVHADSRLMAANALVRLGLADGCVAGAVHATGDVIRAALWLLGPAPGVRTVSSAFYMAVAPFRGTHAEVLTFTDCAVVPQPDASQLADIAIAAADDRRRIVGDEPCVALLSYSTRGSGSGESVEKVQAAVAEIRRRRPELTVDGDLQGDAAIVEGVATRKAPGSSVGGRANVLVFPDLDAGNIAYKLVQRLAAAQAIGPILQGMRRPSNDLSRGATTEDIFNVAAITALQADDGALLSNGIRQETDT